MSSNSYLKTPQGWSKWNLLPTTVNNVNLPDVSLPRTYLPSSSFWLQSIMDHCNIPWLSTYDIMDLYLLGGGSFTVVEALNRLAIINLLFEVAFKNETFGIGFQSPPETGYCIGDIFKQHVYIRLDIQNNGDVTTATNANIQLLQNYRFKRIYVQHGEILNIDLTSKSDIFPLRYVIDIGIEKDEMPFDIYNFDEDILFISGSIKYSGKIIGIKKNWNIIVDIDKSYEAEPSIGDFYEIPKTWIIENPYLLSGFWEGTENEYNKNNGITDSSGLNLYRTSHIKPYIKSKFLGVYIWQNIGQSQVDWRGFEPAYPFINPPLVGSSMNSDAEHEWAFLGFGNSTQSEIYKNDIRYEEIIESMSEGEGFTRRYDERAKASFYQYNELLKNIISGNDLVSYWRIDISGGYITRHNFYAPCLKDSYLYNNGSFFKILDHVEAGIIDVSVIGVDGSILNPYQHQDFEIINQYGWFITEHYESNSNTESNRGFAYGIISNISNDYVKVDAYGDNSVSWTKYNGLDFITRYVEMPKIDSNIMVDILQRTIRTFEIYSGYRLVKNDGTEYIIDSLHFYTESMTGPNIPYSYLATVGQTNLKKGDIVYLAFNKTFETISNFSKSSGYSFIVNKIDKGLSQESYFLSGDSICIDALYYSNPYKLDLPENIRLGVTGGYLFGIGSNGSAQSNIGNYFYITTAKFYRGLASLFYALREEDWLLYQDINTSKLTIRKGALNYKDFPYKMEVIIGAFVASEDIEVFDGYIKLNKKYERLQRLLLQGIEEYRDSQSSALLFGINNINNIYGFAVSGDGIIDLQMSKLENIDLSNDYVDETNKAISPVYVYKTGVLNNAKNNAIEIGTETSNDIYIRGGNVNKIVAQYIDDNQTISESNLFDIIKVQDGEFLIVYGQDINEFKIFKSPKFNDDKQDDGYFNNSYKNETVWNHRSAVFILGSHNEGYLWGPPSLLKSNVNVGRMYYDAPIMLINDVDYVGCIYDSLSNKISVFVRAYSGDYAYIGCLSVNINSFLHNVIGCQYNDFSFYYRPPILTDSFIYDKNLSWITNSNDVIDVDFSYNSASQYPYVPDNYIRILGTVSGCQVIQSGDFGIVSTSLLKDNTYIMLYDSEQGIRAIYSSDQGMTWYMSRFIYARNGRGGVLVGQYLFYIAEDGVRVKKFDDSDFLDNKTISLEGNSNGNVEQNRQSYIDLIPSTLVGSGKIDYQRISGYVTNSNIIKIFFYDNNGRIKGFESSDGDLWKVCDNF